MSIIEIDPKRLDDDTFRRDYFGASHAAVLFGEHPFESAADYWIYKQTGVRPEPTTEEQARFDRGRHLEAGIISWLAEQIDYRIETVVPAYAQGHIIAVPDGEVSSLARVDGHHGGMCVEVKSTSWRDVTEPQKHWLHQVQATMFATGHNACLLAWLDGNLELRYTVVYADVAWQESIVEEVDAFMASVAAGVMPNTLHPRAEHIIRMHPDPVDAVEVGDRGFELVTDYWNHKQAETYHEGEARQLRDELFNLAGSHVELTSGGNVIATLRARKGRLGFDAKRFEAEHPELFAEYTYIGAPTRALEIPKPIKKSIEEGNQP